MTASAAKVQVAERRGDHLVGREQLIHLLVDAARSGSGAVVQGARGMGTTSVLRAARAQTVEAGRRVVEIEPREPDEPAFAALRAVLGEAVPSTVDAGSLAAAADALAAHGGPGSFVVCVDGLDRLADPVAAVVHQVVASGAALLLASAGPTDPSLTDLGAPWWWDVASRVEIAALGRDDADRLAERLIGGPIDAPSRDRLWVSAQGNHGWIVAMAEATREGGGWAWRGGLWHMAGKGGSAVDAGILAELEALPVDVRTVLEVLALSEALPIDDAEEIAGPGPLVEAERRRLVRTDEASDGALWCAVASRLVGTALRSSLGPPDERRRWGRVAEVLARSTTSGPLIRLGRGRAILGAGRAGSGARTADLDAVLAGAAAAHTLSRWEDGASLAGSVWRARRDPVALTALTLSLGMLSDHEAIRTLSAELQAHGAHPEAHARHATTIAISQFHTGDPAGAFATTARARATGPPSARGALEVFESRLRSFAGDQDEADALAAPWCDAPEAELRVEALTVRASVAGIRGATETAIAGYDEACALALSIPDAPLALAGTPYLFRLGAVAEAGRLTEALAGAEAIPDDTVRGADATSRGWMALLLGRCHLMAGRPQSSVRFFAQAVADMGSLHRPGWLAHPAAALVAAHAAAGDLAAAEAARAAWDEIPAHAVVLFRSEELRFVAWLDAAQGDEGAAASLLSDAVEQARSAGAIPYEVAALHDIVRLAPGAGRLSGAAEALTSLAHPGRSPLVEAHAAQARAIGSGSVAGLEAAADAYEALGLPMDAAETWSEVARRVDDVREQAVARRRVADLLAGSEGLSTPLLDAAGDGPLLTDREQEIAAMVASGSSRQEAADHLVVSVRTIDSHLQRAYRKLGVRGRDELVETLQAVRPFA
ncbi:LuxR family transcriptional regulator [soil metagenome]